MARSATAPSTPELLRLLLEQMEEYALFFMTPEGIITDWFPGATQVFGFAPEEIIGQSAVQLFNHDDIARGADRHEFDKARLTGRAEDDRWHVRKDGTLFWGSGVTFALRDVTGEVVAFAKLTRNRTDVKTQTETLDNAQKAHSRREEQHRIFLGTLAHELRNPLAPLMNALELIKRAEPHDPMVLRGVQVIDRQLAVMRRLVDDLLDTTRITTGKVQLEVRVLDLRDVVNAAIEASRPQAEQRRQELGCVMIDTPALVRGDEHRLQQVFLNLLSNAIKYTPPEGRIYVALTTEGGDVVTVVEDTGIGMGAEILPKVFDLFTQEEIAEKSAGGGLGLGLPLVRELVRLHGGTVQARSDGRDKGSVFTVRLAMHAATQT